MEFVFVYAAALAVFLAIGGVEQNPAPGVEIENVAQVLCSGCERNLTSEHSVTRVDAGYTTAVETCRVKCLTAGNGAMVGVDGTGFVN
jgi:hypothetical protein